MDFEKIKEQLDIATEKLRNAQDISEVCEAFSLFNQEYIKLSSRFARLFIGVYSDVLDQEAAMRYDTEVEPISELMYYTPFAKAVSESAFYDQIVERYGKVAIRLICRKGEMNAKYDACKDVPDPDEEQQTYQMLSASCGGDYMAHAEEFDALLQAIAEKNDAKAKALGYQNFCDLGNHNNLRFEYDEDDIMCLCEQVRLKISPYLNDFQQRYAEELKNSDFKPKDLVSSMRKMMSKLGSEASSYWNTMEQGGHINCEPSDNKMPGVGLQRFIEEDDVGPIIMSKSNMPKDVMIISHEFGHSFQEHLAFNAKELALHVLASTDLMEISSRTMELYALYFAEDFFDDARAYHIWELEQMLDSIVSYSASTVFEHWMYHNVSASKEDRKAKYIEVYHSFYPFRERTDEQILKEMYSDSPIFFLPKYEFCYVPAWFNALEMAVAYGYDPKESYERYLALNKDLAFYEYSELLKQYGLHNPFVPESVDLFLKNAKKLESILL